MKPSEPKPGAPRLVRSAAFSSAQAAPACGERLESPAWNAEDSAAPRLSDLVLNQPSDDEVVERVRAGERALFEVLMRRHNRRIFRAARSILASDDEAEDVMQDAYVRAFEHLGDYAGRARFSTWLTRIAVHEALARARRLRPLARLDDDLDEELRSMSAKEPTPERGTSDGELRAVLESAIADLPADFRVVFVLRAIEQMSVADVAEALEIPAETVKTRFFRARVRLQQRLMARLDLAADGLFDFHLSRCDRVVDRVLLRLGSG